MPIEIQTQGRRPSLENLLPNDGIGTDGPTPTVGRTRSMSDAMDIPDIHEALLQALDPDSRLPSNVSGNALATTLVGIAGNLDHFNAVMRGEFNPSGNDEQIVAVVEHALKGEPNSPARRGSMAVGLQHFLTDHLQNEAVDLGRALSPEERATSVLGFLGRVFSNDFQHPAARWGANLANVGLRTGFIVGMATCLRQLVGLHLEQALLMGEASVSQRACLGTAAMLLGPALNIAGLIRDEVGQTATAKSRSARAVLLCMSVAALAATAATPTGAGQSVLTTYMAGFGTQTAFYTLLRDVMQAFAPLQDNAPINAPGTAASGALYGAAQFGSSEAMGHFAPNSGAGFAMRVARAATATPAPALGGAPAVPDRMLGDVFDWVMAPSSTSTTSPQSRVNHALSAMLPNVTHDLRRGLINAAGEDVDDLVRVWLSRFFGVRQTVESARREAMAQGQDPQAAVDRLPQERTEGARFRTTLRVPTAGQFADQMLNTSALRTSAFEFIVAGTLVVAEALGKTGLSQEVQDLLVNAATGCLCAAIYGPFLYGHARTTPPTSEPNPLGERAEVRETQVWQRTNVNPVDRTDAAVNQTSV